MDGPGSWDVFDVIDHILETTRQVLFPEEDSHAHLLWQRNCKKSVKVPGPESHQGACSCPDQYKKGRNLLQPGWPRSEESSCPKVPGRQHPKRMLRALPC